MSEAAKGRELSDREKAWIAKARAKAEILYEGVVTPHRSCGIALAETFNLATPAYQSLRRGGITGDGYCGAIRAGEQVLGELLGDPDPTAPVTESLRNAVTWFKTQVPARVDRRQSPDYICNNLTRQHGDFGGPERAAHCTSIAAEVADLTAEALVRFGPGLAVDIKPIEDLS
ncbi:MAG: hypothetical protein KJO07_10985 [Deltaproteobacteria bacterium]|nr:hypothetical protein [Deltaproteobacteria bacterium]